MDAALILVNWTAVLVGTAAAFALGMIWFGPIFGKVWPKGSHDIKPPEKMPVAALTIHLLGTFLMSWVIGATASTGALITPVLLTLAFACLMLASSLLSQKSPGASLVDSGYVLATGAIMIAVQALL